MVLAAGLWTSELARLAGASVALYPAEHVWVMTEEASSAGQDAPFLRDLDGYIYIRQYRGRYVIGAFEPNGKPIAPSVVPTDGFAEFGPDWDHFAPVARGGSAARAGARVDRLRPLPARAGELHARLQLPAGVRAGVRRAVRRGRPQLAGDHLRPGRRPGGGRMDRRRAPDDGSRRGRCRADGALDEPAAWLHERTEESLGGLYELHWPGKQPRTGRDVRRVPLYEPFRAAGAAFGQAAGWERANWFEPGSWTRRSATTSRRRRGSRPFARRSGPPGRASRSSTCRRTRSSSSQGPERARGPAAAGDVRPGRGAGPDRLHAPVQRARRDRDGPDHHAARRGPVPGPRPDPDPAPDRRRCSGAGCRRSAAVDATSPRAGRPSTWPARAHASCWLD